VPLGDPESSAYFQAVSCAAAGDCTAVGALETEAGGAPIGTSEKQGPWEAPSELSPPEGQSASEGFTELGAVECFAAERCLAAGESFSSAGSTPVIASSEPALQVSAPSLPAAQVGEPY